MTPDEAKELASRYGIPLGRNFHSLNFDVVNSIRLAAKSRKYRAPKNANGSTARYFYAYLQRAARRSNATNAS